MLLPKKQKGQGAHWCCVLTGKEEEISARDSVMTLARMPGIHQYHTTATGPPLAYPTLHTAAHERAQPQHGAHLPWTVRGGWKMHGPCVTLGECTAESVKGPQERVVLSEGVRA